MATDRGRNHGARIPSRDGWRVWFAEALSAKRIVTLCLLVSAALLLPMSVRAADNAAVEQGIAHLEAMQSAFHAAIERAQPSMVSVLLDNRSEGRSAFPNALELRGGFQNDPFARESDMPKLSGFGSGIVIAPKGFVLTCYHVIRPAIKSRQAMVILVRDQSGETYNARIHAADPRSDLAVIALERRNLRGKPINLPPIKVGNGGSLFRGQFVLAIGNPYGLASDGSVSASWGIISNIRRKPGVSDQDDALTLANQGRTLVQTDARMNMGISGGALVDLRGNLVGVTVAFAAAAGFETPGGFALPTDDMTRQTIDTLIAGKEVEYGFLGIRPGSLDASDAAKRGYPAVDGALVLEVFDYLPAYRAGLRQNDLITAINGKPIHNQQDLVIEVGGVAVGSVVEADVVRQGIPRPLRLSLPLAKFPVRGDVVFTVKRPSWQGLRVDHLSTLTGMNPFGDTYVVLPSSGVMVREVDDRSVAHEKGIRSGQVITKVNGKPVYTPAEFERDVVAAKPPVRLSMARGEDIVFEGTTPSPETK